MKNIKIPVHIGLLYFVKKKQIVYFDSFGVEHIPEEIEKFIGNKNIKANIYRAQANDSVMCGYFCIGFIDFMFAGKTLIDYTNMFSPHDFNKNDSITFSYFKDVWKRSIKYYNIDLYLIKKVSKIL